MKSERYALCAILSGVGLGLASLASPSFRNFIDKCLGLPAATPVAVNETFEPRAEFAKPALNAPLQPSEDDELARGYDYYGAAKYSEAVHIFGKYAMRGNAPAQVAIGGMYAFGLGLPIDRAEALRWLALASNQGNQGANVIAAKIRADPDWERRVAALAAATSRYAEWRRSGAGSGFVQQDGASTQLVHDPGLPEQIHSYNKAAQAYETGGMVSPSTQMGARRSVDEAYGSGSASRGYPGGLGNSPQFEPASPVILNRAGPGTYSDGTGDIYTQAGPHGVVNTRTGEFSPTN